MVTNQNDNSLLQQIQSKTLPVAGAIHVVRGAAIAKPFVFLHFYGVDVNCSYLLKVLQNKGYGGSVLIWTCNLPNGIEIACTGQLHALIVVGESVDKGWGKNVEEILHKKSLPEVPRLEFPRWNKSALQQSFGSFLDEFCPLDTELQL